MLALLAKFLGPSLAGIVTDVAERLIPDPAAREKFLGGLLDRLAASDAGQVEINKAEAMTGGAFRAGWRPFIGWVCGAALAYQFVVVPIGTWLAAWAGVAVPPPPRLDENLWELMFGMLGLAGIRTVDKIALAKAGA